MTITIIIVIIIIIISSSLYLSGDEQLILVHRAQSADLPLHCSRVPHSLDDVTSTRLAFRTQHRSSCVTNDSDANDDSDDDHGDDDSDDH